MHREALKDREGKHGCVSVYVAGLVYVILVSFGGVFLSMFKTFRMISRDWGEVGGGGGWGE